MTIIQAILGADLLRPNQLDQDLKIYWLAELDGQLQREVLMTHEGYTDPPFPGFGPDVVETTRLMLPFPYDQLYVHYLVMRIDRALGELERYNNDAAVFNRLYQSWAGFHARTHRPLGAAALRF